MVKFVLAGSSLERRFEAPHLKVELGEAAQIEVPRVPALTTHDKMPPARTAVVARAVPTALIAVSLVFIFEIARMVLLPSLRAWAYHGIAILFSSAIGGFATFRRFGERERTNSLASSIEDRYRLLFECSPTGAYLISEDGRFLDCNLSFCRIFGYTKREELIGGSIDRLFPSAVERAFQTSLLRSEGSFTNLEQRLHRRDGSEVWVLHSAVNVPQLGSTVQRSIRGTMIDITEKREAEYRESQLAAIVRCTTYAVIALTSEGIIESWNRGAEQLFGYTAGEVIGRSIGIIASPDRLDEFRSILERVRSGTVVDVETVRRRKDEQDIAVALSVSAVRSRDGEQVGAAAIIRDIRDRKRAERAILESAAQYRLLFDNNPIPMWVFDRKTLRFLAVNKAAIHQYGFTVDEFLNMTIADIRPVSGVPLLLSAHDPSFTGLHRAGEWQHRTRDNRILDVEIVSHTLEFEGHDAELVAVYDITERNRAEEDARRAERNYQSIFDNAVLGIFQSDLYGRPLAVNQALATIHGFDTPEQMLAEVSDVRRQLFVEPISIAEHLKKLESDEIRGAEADVYRRDGSQTRIRMNLRAARDPEGRPIYIEGMVEDIGEQQRAKTALQLKTTLLEAQSETTLDGMLAVDDQDRILLANRQFGIQFGIPESLLLAGNDLPVREFVMQQAEEPVTFIQKINALNRSPQERSRDEIRLKNGRSFDRYSAPLIDATGKNWGRIWYFREITERKAAEQQIQLLAYFDALTGLPNRTLLRDRLDNALAAARRRTEMVALLHIDLDHFKTVNDSIGHAAGDTVLKQVSERLRASIREPDTVARTEGDGFVVILNGITDLPEASTAARRIKCVIEQPCDIEGQQITPTATIGVAVYPDHGTNSGALIKNAESAMYSGKEAGRNTTNFFSAELNGKALEALALESEMRNALERNQFFLVYQPQMDIKTGRIVGLEALLRWKHPDLGLVPPNKFIPVAERNGLILPIGEWVLRSACTQIRSWQAQGLAVVPVAVNVSAMQFRSKQFASTVRRCLFESGVSPNLLELELTETILFGDGEGVHECLHDLQADGINIALDDFGTGYSSLSYLKRFRVGKLKIDRSFIENLPADHDVAVITKAIISMSKSLKITVIAEGVETEAQLSFLKEHSCDQLQGYWFCKPEYSDSIAKKLFAQSNLSAASTGTA